MLQSFSLFMQRKVEQYRRSSQKIREVSLPLLESGTEIYFPMNIREWLISVRGKLFLACSLSYIGPFYNLTSLEESTSYFLFKRKDSLKGLSCKQESGFSDHRQCRTLRSLNQDWSLQRCWSLRTTLQSTMNAKLSQHGFGPCHENGLIKPIQTIPHNQYVSFILYCGLG